MTSQQGMNGTTGAQHLKDQTITPNEAAVNHGLQCRKPPSGQVNRVRSVGQSQQQVACRYRACYLGYVVIELRHSRLSAVVLTVGRDVSQSPSCCCWWMPAVEAEWLSSQLNRKYRLTQASSFFSWQESSPFFFRNGRITAALNATKKTTSCQTCYTARSWAVQFLNLVNGDSIPLISCRRHEQVWYGILGFNVPLDTV